MAVGGVAVRVTAEALSSGSVRLKRSTAEQLLGPEILLDATGVGTGSSKALVLNPCPAQWFSRPVYAQLRCVPAMAPQGQSLGATDAPPPPCLHCELCGLGAWLRGQGAVPGVHWVQLWRGAGGGLMLRLCDGKPTELPGEEAEAAVEQQVIAVTTSLTAAVKETGASDTAAVPEASAAAAGVHAAGMIVGPAAQAVADAAAPWQLHAPTGRAACMPYRSAWRMPENSCHLGAPGAGADGVGSAARSSPDGDHRGAPMPPVEGGVAVPGRPSCTGILTGRVSNYKIGLRTAEAQGLLVPSLLQEQGLQSRPDWITVHVEGGAGRSASAHEGAQQGQQQGGEFAVRLMCNHNTGRKPSWYLSSVGALLKALRAQDGHTVQLQYKPDGRLVARRAGRQPQQQRQGQGQDQQAAAAAQLASCPADGIFVGYRYSTRMDARVGAVCALWPEIASQLSCGQGAEVEVHPAVADAGGEALGPFRVALKLHTWKSEWPSWRLNGCGGLFRAIGAQDGDAVFMWRSPGDGRLLAGLQPRGGLRRGREEQQLAQQGQGQDAEQQPEQQQEGRQGQQGDGPRRQPRRRARQGGLHRLYGEYVVQEASDGEDEELDVDDEGEGEEWGSGENEVGQEEGPRGPPGDGLSRPSKRARATEAPALQYGGPSAYQQQQVQPTMCPASSFFVGYKHRGQLDARATAVRALWPDLACQLVYGQSIEVEVHPAMADAGGQALGPFRVTLKLYSWPGKPAAWRLCSCRQLFRALGAQDRDEILMWRSPGDGRVMAGAQPRGGVRRDTGVQQQGQPQAQEQEAEQQQQGDGRRRQPQRRAQQGALQLLYGEHDVLAASGGEDWGEEEVDHGDGGAEEEWESEESEDEGQGDVSWGPSCDGLSRPSKRARAAEGPAQQYGGASATQQQMQLAACPAGSVFVGRKHRTQVDVRAAAVHALWPEVASQLACGQSVKVDVHAATHGADVGAQGGGGGEAPGSFRVLLMLYTRPYSSPSWRLNGCGPLFRALGAQDRDAICIWRSPGDGRLMAGVQRRGEVEGDGTRVQAGRQRGAGPGRGGRGVRQVYDVHETTDEEADEDVGLEEDEEEGKGHGGYSGAEHEELEVGFGAGSGVEGQARQSCDVRGNGGGGWGRECAGLGSGGDYEAGVEEEEEEEEEDPGVNWWAREVGGEFGFGEERDEGRQEEEQV